jgi:hypothetical protein
MRYFCMNQKKKQIKSTIGTNMAQALNPDDLVSFKELLSICKLT